MDRLATPLMLLFAGLGARAPETRPQPRWARHFEARGVAGTFVLYEPLADRYRVLDEARARRGFRPQSTFDIANALVGLEVGTIDHEREVFRWDGKPRCVPAWEADHDLASGMRAGVAWVFQEVARRTGKARMREWLARLEYGNRDIGGGIDLFWLQGGLRISALDHVRFLHRLAEGRLPATQRAQRLVREAMVAERTSAYTLFAKAGASSARAPDPVWWWVGWVERKGRPQGHFALNFTPTPKSRPEDCAQIGRAILGEARLLPS